MKDYYFEILEAFDEEPAWYDVHGVPRWCDPEEARYPIHLMGRIRCQSCGKEFWVALGDPVYRQELDKLIMGMPMNVECNQEKPALDDDYYQLAENWHYGDPPAHRCIGDTMNSIPEYEWDEWYE